VPMSMMEQAAGSTAGSVAANWADGATAGISTALAGDRGRGALDAMNETNPNASMAGWLGGGIMGAAGLEMGAAKLLAPGLARFAPRVADTAYGGTYGATNADEGEGMAGAAIGAAAGLGGGILGQKLFSAVGKGFTGVRDPMVQRLNDAGVPLTVGQSVSRSGRFGEQMKAIEDAMTSLPGVGGMVNARRTEGLGGFNAAAFDTAAAPGATITATGADGMRQVRQSVGDAYDSALLPSQIDTTDAQMIADLAQARIAADAIPDVQPTDPRAFANAALRNRIEGGIDPATGMMSGRNFQEAYRGLGRSGRERANSDFGYEVGQVTRQGQDLLGEALERQNPGAFTGFLEANAANRRANVLADAMKNAANQGDELITPAQLNRADVTSTSRLEGKINSASGNRPFYDLATAGQAVLPSRVPDSGTASRMMTGMALGGVAGAGGAGGYALGGTEGAQAGSGGSLAAALALTFGGTKGVQRMATKALLDRPDVAIRIGEQIQRNPRLAGLLGSTAGGNLLASLVSGE
ncbi:MAG: hypothetical protein V4696_03005, partial [Pseudomonadota bacterium]